MILSKCSYRAVVIYEVSEIFCITIHFSFFKNITILQCRCSFFSSKMKAFFSCVMFSFLCWWHISELRMSGTMLPGNLIEKILQILPSLTSLDISDNDFGDEGLIDVCEALKNHKSIIELKLDRNWIHRSKSSTLLNNTTFFSNSDQVHVFWRIQFYLYVLWWRT